MWLLYYVESVLLLADKVELINYTHKLAEYNGLGYHDLTSDKQLTSFYTPIVIYQ